MSLDVSLVKKNVWKTCHCCGHQYEAEDEVFEANITHNLSTMAGKVGEEFYHALWKPEEESFVFAGDIIKVVEKGLDTLKNNPERFKAFSASNGWGTYEQFIPWVQQYLEACKEYPDSIIKVSR